LISKNIAEQGNFAEKNVDLNKREIMFKMLEGGDVKGKGMHTRIQRTLMSRLGSKAIALPFHKVKQWKLQFELHIIKKNC